MRSDPQKKVIRRIRKKAGTQWRKLDERQRRIWAASEAREIGRGGVACVAAATGLSTSTVYRGIRELRRPGRRPDGQRVRRAGGGRKPILTAQPQLATELDRLIDPATRGDPESLLRWTCKSTRKLAEALKKKGFRVSHRKVGQLLRDSGYSMQANRKTIEGRQHPDRDAQFEYIQKEVTRSIRRNQPAISVDTKKKEKLGNMRNGGREWSPKGRPSKVKVHDFPDKKLGKVIPYGVYDIARNEGWVNVGVDHDTAQFAVASIQRWWNKQGKKGYQNAEELVITADSGGSNSSRSRAWRFYLQSFADKTGLRIRVRHFPPGTSKWNKIEHRMFCHITSNWRGKPLETREAVVSLIGSTTTRTGLTISAALDRRLYPTGRKFSDEDMQSIRMKPEKFHGEWNYTIYPRRRAAQASCQ